MIEFHKYQGTGNDFILIDNRQVVVRDNKQEFAKKWCNRRFGIGSDGIIFLGVSKQSDFEMDFYNPDGSQSFCGNGSRCVVQFAKDLGIIREKALFTAIDGDHQAIFNTDQGGTRISIRMNDVNRIEVVENDLFIDTGSPHYISYRQENDTRDILSFGKKIRYSERFRTAGTNVNLVRETGDGAIEIETYERGVENETWSCGTGATACALSLAKIRNLEKGSIHVKVKGGQLLVHFNKSATGFSDIWLEGPAAFVYRGRIDV